MGGIFIKKYDLLLPIRVKGRFLVLPVWKDYIIRIIGILKNTFFDLPKKAAFSRRVMF